MNIFVDFIDPSHIWRDYFSDLQAPYFVVKSNTDITVWILVLGLYDGSQKGTRMKTFIGNLKR